MENKTTLDRIQSRTNVPANAKARYGASLAIYHEIGGLDAIGKAIEYGFALQ